MGTTESAFFYDDTEEVSPSTSTHSAGVVVGPPPKSSTASSAATTSAPPLPKRKGPPRPAKRPSGVSRVPTVKLKGHILGLPESGKRTLLARLQGKDPFHPSVHDTPIVERVEHVLPYQAPSDQPSWDRIQLLVHCAEDFVVQTEPLDFAVILINPQRKRKKVKRYLVEQLHRLLHMLGYRSDGSTESLPSRPFCLCLLLNFRDLTLTKTHVEESNVTMWTMEVLQDYPSLDAQRLVLQCGQTSLKNCYGLSLLHHFIYQSYLFRRQYQLEYDMLQVRQAQRQAKAPPVQRYDEFLAVLDGKPPSQRKERRKKEKSSEAEKSSGGRRKFMPKSGGGDGEHVPADRSPSPPPSAPPKSSADALEAFLASSDEEEEEDDEPKTSTSRAKAAAAGNGENDDDDDFVLAEVPADTPDNSEHNETESVHETSVKSTHVKAPKSSKGVDTKGVATEDEEKRAESAKSAASTADSSDASVGSKEIHKNKHERVARVARERNVDASKTDVRTSVSEKNSQDETAKSREDEGSLSPAAVESNRDNRRKVSDDQSEVVRPETTAGEDKETPSKRSDSPVYDDYHNETSLGSSTKDVSNANGPSLPTKGEEPGIKTQNDEDSPDNVEGSSDARDESADKHDAERQSKEASAEMSEGRNKNEPAKIDKNPDSVISSDDSSSDSSTSAADKQEARKTVQADEKDESLNGKYDNDVVTDPEPVQDQMSGNRGTADSSALSETAVSSSEKRLPPGCPPNKSVSATENEARNSSSQALSEDDGEIDAVKEGVIESADDTGAAHNEQMEDTQRTDSEAVREDGEEGTSTTIDIVTTTAKDSHDEEDDDDDEEFFVEDPSAPPTESPATDATSAKPAVAAKAPAPASNAKAASENPAGLSEAAMAAIAAAQKDFESMLQPAADLQKKKKKKDKEAKEKKKEKKKKKETAV